MLIRGGIFLMGSPETERDRREDEELHEVEISSFYADPCEVLQADYQAIMGTNPSMHKGDSLPVENVSWEDAVKYCNALSKKSGLTPVYTIRGSTVLWNRRANGYRLMTEAEWEYAARAGTQTAYDDGEELDAERHNFSPAPADGAEAQDAAAETGERGPVAGASLEANAFGLYHMLGNVSEWCFDNYGLYDPENDRDPAGPESGSLRIIRGGSYLTGADQLRCACRFAAKFRLREAGTGFRICRNAEGIDETVTTKYDSKVALPEWMAE